MVQTKVLTNSEIIAFQKIVLDFYAAQGRQQLPWRKPLPSGEFDPYAITVSEIMLQQTQVKRVIEKYIEFLHVFPNVLSLSNASLSEVLTVWSGLGYYRRAKFLHQAAQKVAGETNGVFPHDQLRLSTLPGIGKNTAGAIIAYSYNEPVVFIETNIRAIFLHHFFADQQDVSDSTLLPLIEQTLDKSAPRIWYWALMDYGSHLKATHPNPSRRSQHHVKQPAFKGSRREVRGQVLRVLTAGSATLAKLKQQIASPLLEAVLEDLISEQMVSVNGKVYILGR